MLLTRVIKLFSELISFGRPVIITNNSGYNLHPVKNLPYTHYFYIWKVKQMSPNSEVFWQLSNWVWISYLIYFSLSLLVFVWFVSGCTLCHYSINPSGCKYTLKTQTCDMKYINVYLIVHFTHIMGKCTCGHLTFGLQAVILVDILYFFEKDFWIYTHSA